jgi:hypothetical protein
MGILLQILVDLGNDALQAHEDPSDKERTIDDGWLAGIVDT